MRQLVGSQCRICYERINDVLTGRFCDACESPIHSQCVKQVRSRLGEDRCNVCSANLDEANLPTAEEERQRRMRVAEGKSCPVSVLCPKCGAGEYKKRKPERWIAFTADRVCTACQTRYTPPTPAWAAALFILIGLPLAGLGLISVVISLLRGNPAALPATACEGSLGVLGVLSIVHGIRSLANPGKDLK